MHESLKQINHESSPGDQVPQHAPRSPALSVLICFATGILLDACLNLAISIWLQTAVIVLCGWLVSYLRHRRIFATLMLLALVVCLGALRHHEFWYCRSPEDVTRLLSSESQQHAPKCIVRLTGQISSRNRVIS